MKNRLDTSRKNIAKLDDQILKLAARRMNIAKDIERIKRNSTDRKIIRKNVEDKKIARYRMSAKRMGLNPSFAQTLLYLLIAESTREQMDQRQG
jgi:chorismate mutase